MSDVAIKVENISKIYQIGDTSSGSLRETLSGLFSSGKKKRTEDFWALKDISFEVKKGEAVGIVGKNGAGKSTLLKVLSRITEPTKGRIEINGRVSSLLEVGTGFHPELTGRENVFLNGTILGMSRAEVKAKFDEIVAFSGVEKFLDTPVKRYSSGMKVRLAFAVAAHLEPEILIIDEVLAVGDAEFQKKCLGKMEDVAGQGRTILFVSHHMDSVSELCSKSIFLKKGMKLIEGDTESVIKQYLNKSAKQGYIDLQQWNEDRIHSGTMRWTALETLNEDYALKSIFSSQDTMIFRLSFRSDISRKCIVGLAIRDEKGNVVYHLTNTDEIFDIFSNKGTTTITIKLDKILLNDGEYFISLWLGDGTNILHDRAGDCLSFTIDNSAHGKVRSHGLVKIPSYWKYSNEKVFEKLDG